MNYEDCVEPAHLQHVFQEQRQDSQRDGFNQDPDSEFQIIDSHEVFEAQQQPHPQT